MFYLSSQQIYGSCSPSSDISRDVQVLDFSNLYLQLEVIIIDLQR